MNRRTTLSRLLAAVALAALLLLGSAWQSAAPPANFVDVTAAKGVNFVHVSPHTAKKFLIETMGSGVALFDYDNDGRLDLFLVNAAPIGADVQPGTTPQKSGPRYWNRLFHQTPDGTFEDVTEKSGLAGTGIGMGVAVADFDNDGFADLYVTAYGGNRLYRNNGNGTFTDVTAKAGVAGSGWSSSAAWVDLDRDGLLDLVVLRYLTWDFNDIWCGEHKEELRAYCHPDTFRPTAPLAFHNEGNGRFTEVASQIGLAVPGKGLGIAIGDYDRDGNIDLAIANDSMPEFLFHNKGSGTFEEKGLASQMAVDEDGRTFAGMGIDMADFNNDGLTDLVIDALANQMYALFQNAGDGSFTYVTRTSGLGKMSLLHSGWGLRLFDFDNDGWKDLLIAQGHDLDTIELTSPHLSYREPLLLARNTGGAFVDVSAQSGPFFKTRLAGRGLAIGDIDNDGRIDAVVTTNDGPAYVLRNVSPPMNHWVTLALTGRKSNRDAIGAVVNVATPSGQQSATVTTTGSYLSSGDKRVHFGLGKHAVVERIEIRWPGGTVQRLTNVQADRIVKIEEPVTGQVPPAQ